jgi:chromosome segregation ATPase
LQNIDEEVERVTEEINLRASRADKQSEHFALAEEAHKKQEQIVQDRQAELDPLKQECDELTAAFRAVKEGLMKLNVCSPYRYARFLKINLCLGYRARNCR